MFKFENDDQKVWAIFIIAAAAVFVTGFVTVNARDAVIEIFGECKCECVQAQ